MCARFGTVRHQPTEGLGSVEHRRNSFTRLLLDIRSAGLTFQVPENVEGITPVRLRVNWKMRMIEELKQSQILSR